MSLSNISVKYSEKNSVSREVFKDRRTSDGNRQSSLWARILLLHTHSLTHSEGQYASLRLRGSELQKLIIPLYSLYNSLYNPTQTPNNDNNVKNKKSVQLLQLLGKICSARSTFLITLLNWSTVLSNSTWRFLCCNIRFQKYPLFEKKLSKYNRNGERYVWVRHIIK